MKTTITNKRGRKSTTAFGYENEMVKTWAKLDGEWIYQGMSKRKLTGITNEGAYNYYMFFGTEMRQEA